MANGVFTNTATAPAVSANATGALDAIDASAEGGYGLLVGSVSNKGVYAVSNSSQGVYGICEGTSAGVGGHGVDGYGVEGDSVNGIGMHAVGAGVSVGSPPPISQAGLLAQGGSGPGIYASSTTNNGVFGTQTDPQGNDLAAGVYGSSNTLDGNGVIGEANNGASAYGVWGKSSSGFAGYFEGNVQVEGNLACTGTKPFIQAHPTDPSREIVYVALEGGEAGTYVRGTGHLIDGNAVIALPEHFALVTENQGLSAQLTPRGIWLQLYVVELDTTQLNVREAQGQSGGFDFLIHGIRRGYAQHEVIRMKR
jgi:hypothetical protein